MFFAGGERGEILRTNNDDAQGSGPAGGSELLGQRRSLEPRSTRRYRAPSRLFSLVPRRVLEMTGLAGGED
jgi:hypothetical protein